MRLIAAIVASLSFFCLLCFSPPASSQIPPAPHLDVSDDQQHFSYSISQPQLIRDAWIEVLDRPILLGKQSVPVQANGTLDWDWDRSPLNGWEHEEDNLTLSIWDPRGETIVCDVNTVMTAHPGGVVSTATVGARQKITPYSRLDFSFLRVSADAPSATFPITGQDLSPSTKFTISVSYGARCNSQNLHVQVLDFTHALATLEAACFQRPGRISITLGDATLDDPDTLPSVHIASPRSPQLVSVSPSAISSSPEPAKLQFVLRGRGFTPGSIVYAGFNPDESNSMTDQLMLETAYVSPTELRARIIANSVDSDTFPLPVGKKMRFWVKGDEQKSELSAYREIPIRSSSQDAFDIPGQRSLQRWPEKAAVVTSVSPFPIHLMNRHSPEKLMVTIHGENFVPEDKVRFSFGNSADNDREMTTQYVSPTTLRAWLPRQFWRKHSLTFRLVVLTTTGQQYSHQLEVKEEDE